MQVKASPVRIKVGNESGMSVVKVCTARHGHRSLAHVRRSVGRSGTYRVSGPVCPLPVVRGGLRALDRIGPIGH